MVQSLANGGAQATQPLLLCEILDNGTMTYPEMRLRDLYKYIQGRVADGLATRQSFDAASGVGPSEGKTKASRARSGSWSLSNGKNLHSRDLRRLDMPFSASNQPMVMARNHVVLLNFDPLRAVVLVDRLVVLVPDGADSILSELQKRLFGPHALEDMEDPDGSFSSASRTFAFRAIEALLVIVVLNLEKELLEVSDSMNAVLRRLHHVRYMSVEALETLRMLKNRVGVQLARAHNTKRAVMDVLDEDEDMALMNLSRQQAEPHLFHPVVLNEALEDHEDFELLYEACLQSVNTLSTNLELAQHQITNAEEFNMMKLDTARNRLLTAEIIFSLVSMCASLGSLVASLFGMNLTNHLEDSSTAFGRVTAVTAISTVSLATLVCIIVSRQGTLGVSRS